MPQHEPPPGPGDPNAGGPSPWQDAQRKLREPGGAELLIVLASAIFLVDSFLPWYSFSALGVRIRFSGWDVGFLGVMAILFAIAAGALAGARQLGWTTAIGDVKDGLLYVALGGGALGFALLRLLTELSGSAFGLYLAIALGAVLIYGGMLKRKAEGA